MAITSIYYSTRADGVFRRSLDGGDTWTGVLGFVSSGNTFGNFVGISPYIDKYVELLRIGEPTFYTNDRYVTNGFSSTGEIEASAQLQILDKYKSFIADISGFRRSSNSFLSYEYRTEFSTGGWSIPDSVRFWMSCPEKGVMVLNIDDEPFLYRTNDGGQAWTPLSGAQPLGGVGLIPAAGDVGGVWCDLNTTIIVVATFDKIWRSTDSGTTFNSILSFAEITQTNIKTQLVQGSQNCLYFIDNDRNVWKSVNQGQTWSIIITLPGAPSSILAIAFDNEDNGFVSVDTAVYRVYQTNIGYDYELSETSPNAVLKLAIVTYDCGCPEGFTYDVSLDECTKLDSTGKIGNLYTDFVECPYILTNCKDSEDIIYADASTSLNLESFVSKIISYDDACYQVAHHNSLENDMVTIDATSMLPYQTCFECSPVYTLFSCDNLSTIAYCTLLDLSEYAGTNTAIKIAVDGIPADGCFIVGSDIAGVCEGTSEITVLDTVISCAECNPAIFKLTGCINTDIVIYIQGNEFEAIDGKSVTLLGYPELCWSVEKVESTESNIISVVYDNVYTDCDCCKQYTCKS